MAIYPNGIYAPVTPNVTDPLNINDHFTKVNDEIVALQNEGGLNPRGEFSDVAARLLAIGQANNLLLNGNQEIDQANDGLLNPTPDGAYMTDNHKWNQSGSGSIFYGQFESLVPPNGQSMTAMRIEVIDSTSIISTDHYDFTTFIEGFDYYQVHNGVEIRFTFFVFSDVPGTYGVRLMNNAGNRAYTTTFSVSSPGVWEPKTITFLTDDEGTWEFDEKIGLQITITLAAGSNFQTGITESFEDGNKQTTGAQINFMLNSGNVFMWTQAKMGRFTSPLLNRPIALERAIAKRYVRILGLGLLGVWLGAIDLRVYGIFHDAMRIAPTAELLTSTPNVTEVGVAVRIGSGSTIPFQITSINGFKLTIDGFTGATIRNPVEINDNRLLLLSARF